MRTLTSIALAGFAGVCAAQSVKPIAPRRGTVSLGFSADWFEAQHESPQTTLILTPSLFLSDAWEVRTPFALVKLFGTTETLFGLGVRWHPAVKRTLSLVDPFLGALVEQAEGSGGFREELWAGQVGVNYFVANNVAVTGLLTVGRDRSFGVTQTTTHFTAGFTVFFAGS